MDQEGQYLAQNDLKCIFWAKFGCFGAKISNFYGRKQKFLVPIFRKNHLGTLFALEPPPLSPTRGAGRPSLVIIVHLRSYDSLPLQHF